MRAEQNCGYVVVCSHNTLKGPHGSSIFEYCKMRPDILCLQEGLIGSASGEETVCSLADQLTGMSCLDACDPLPSIYEGIFNSPGQIHSSGILYDAFAILYNAKRIELMEEPFFIPLPRIEKVPWLPNLLWVHGEPTHRHAMVAQFKTRNSSTFTVVNFHFYAECDNGMRVKQAQGIADDLVGRGITERVVLCGDTNAVAWRPSRQREELRKILQPFEALGASDRGSAPTHSFSRLAIQKWPALRPAWNVIGKAVPERRYDVIVTDLPISDGGTCSVDDSDHALVHARINVS